MKRIPAVALVFPLLLAVAPASAQQPHRQASEEVFEAWDRGDYIPALEGFARLLEEPGGDRFLERIAVITGELHHTVEVAPDGHDVRFSPDGRYGSYETGSGADRVTHIVRIETGARKVAEVRGFGLAFSPGGDRVAYLAVDETPELQAARRELDRAVAGGDRQATFQQRGAVAYLEAKNSRVIVRDLATQRERRLESGGLVPASLAFGADGATVYAVAGRDGEDGATEIYALAERGAPTAVTRGEGYKAAPVAVKGGRYLVYGIVARSPVPTRPGAAPLAQRASADLQRVVVHDLTTGRSRSFPGGAAVVARDGSAVAFLSGDGEANLVQVVPLGTSAEPVTVARTTDPVSNPAISPDGRLVAYQRMLREDWELFVARADGSGETRLTREVQHDLDPQFLTSDRLLAVMGEGRHRRSYLYDLATGERTRFFHNNTVRTIAPEYDWAVGPDGTKVLIVAERDGDTVSPERGVYLTDLDRRVTKSEVLDRVRASLAAERDLRERGRALFAPIAEEVQAAVDRVSKTRIFEYERVLFDFGSKHITRPGNRKASEYLFDTLKSWGYEPEYQWFEPRPGIRTANVVATLRGTTDPELVYVVGSHYDSVERGPGADDNTSGTAVLLETARVLRDRPLPATVQFVFFTGEEAGLLGSREFVRRALADGVRVVGALNNDMMGYANDHHLDNTIRYSNPGIRDLQHAAAFLFSEMVTYDALYYKSTDAHALYDGFGDVVGGIGSYPVLGNPHYHQSHDVLETIDHDLLRETARTNVASIMRLASGPSRLTGLELVRRDGRNVAVRWNAAPERGVARYIVAYGPAGDPLRRRVEVGEPRATLTGIEPGMVISVKAIGERGLEGWDWARLTVRGR